MLKARIVWGVCWLNEPLSMIIHFMDNSLTALSRMGVEVYPIVFDAKFKTRPIETAQIKSCIKNVVIVKNRIDTFPNKNYGIAVIAKYARMNDVKYLAVVDPDWAINNYDLFLKSLLDPIVEKEVDILIPNIGDAAGRDNLLVGKVAMSLFYPEYVSVIKTVFPGVLIGSTDKICEICLSSQYHFDWGGEWDVFSYAVKMGFRIGSRFVKVKNIRHRDTASKMLDAYQMWRAVFCNVDFIMRYKNMDLFNGDIKIRDEFSSTLLKNSLSIKEQISYIIKFANNETQRQLLYMLLYPLASIIGEMPCMPNIRNMEESPYEISKIGYISDLAVHCFRSAIVNLNLTPEEIHKTANRVIKNSWNTWDKELQRNALEMAIKDIGSLM